ncbi:MAG: DUF4923 family protein [Bacteroidales bacterium]|jgi:hypothetical protein|nr:DUF4923 family protein [Bacteroidales bacterium]
MKKLVSIVALAVAFTVSANAQSILGNFLGTLTTSDTASNVLTALTGTVYSAPISLNGTYTYNGSAISASSSEGGIVANLAGTAVTSGLEAKADEILAKVGIVPGAMKFTFNNTDETFVLNVGSLSIPGTYKVGEGEKTVTLTFGKTLKFFCMTGNLESSLNGARMVFPANAAVNFLKKIASKLGESSSSLSAISKLADGYDNFKVGFKLSK